MDAARVLRDAEADVQPRRARIPLETRGEHPPRLFVGVKLQQVVAPVEQVLLGRIHVRGALVLLRRRQPVAAAFADVGEQVVQLRGVAGGDHLQNQRTRLVEVLQLEQRQREVVPAGVVVGIDRARALQVGKRRLQLVPLQIKRRELILRVEAVRVAPRRVEEALFDDGGGLRGARRGGLRCGSRPRHDEQREREQKTDARYQYSFAPS